MALLPLEYNYYGCKFVKHIDISCLADLGRTASHYYIKYDTVEVFNEDMNMTTDCVMDDKAIFAMISKAQEFEQLKVRFDFTAKLFWLITHVLSFKW